MYCYFEEKYFTMNRGDTFELPLRILPDDYEQDFVLQDEDKIYVAILEPHQSFENALIRKVITNKSIKDGNGNYLFTLEPEDTEYVLTGKYFIMIKLSYKDNFNTKIKTILPMREFFIEGTDKHISEDNFVVHEIDVNEGSGPDWIPLE